MRTKRLVSSWPGVRHVNIIKTGDRSYCIIAEWTDMDALTKARPNMIAMLEFFIPRIRWRTWAAGLVSLAQCGRRRSDCRYGATAMLRFITAAGDRRCLGAQHLRFAAGCGTSASGYGNSASTTSKACI